MSTVRSPFSNQLIMSHLSSILIAFHQFFTWIALGDVDLSFSLTLVRKANVLEEKNYVSRVII